MNHNASCPKGHHHHNAQLQMWPITYERLAEPDMEYLHIIMPRP